MGSLEKFCLKWNDFQSNISTSFQDLRKGQDFSDVTLTCDGDTRIEAHRVILAGSSKFFSRVLKQQQHPHPLLYMRGMTADQLSSVVDFIYHGEANIFQEDLDSFLAVAEELQLKGLHGTESNSQHANNMDCGSQQTKPIKSNKMNTPAFPHKERKVIQQTYKNEHPYLDDIQLQVQPEQETEKKTLDTSLVPSGNTVHTNYKELDNTINSMMMKSIDGKWACNVCEKIDHKKDNMKTHIEANHIEGVSHPCSLCEKSFRSRHSLSMHIFRFHKIQ
jgi:hypothetical protein